MLDLALLILVAVSAAREREGRPPILARRWSVVDFLFGAQIAAVVVVTFGTGVVFAAELLSPSGIHPGMSPQEQVAVFTKAHPATLFCVLAFQDVVLFVVPILYFRYKYKLRMRDIGLTTRRLRRWTLIAFGLAVVAFFAVAYIELLNERALERYQDLGFVKYAEGFSERRSPETLVGELIKAWHPFVGILAVAILAPIAEEVFFRGFTYNIFKARLGVAWGIIISSVIFAGIHFDPARLPTYLIIAAILAYSYEKTRNLIVPIVIHFVNNLAAIVGLYWFPQLGQ